MNNDKLPEETTYSSTDKLTSIEFDCSGMLKIIRSSDNDKAHRLDDNIVRKIEVCDESLVKQVAVIFMDYIGTGVDRDIWKKSNIVPVHKKVIRKL